MIFVWYIFTRILLLFTLNCSLVTISISAFILWRGKSSKGYNQYVVIEDKFRCFVTFLTFWNIWTFGNDSGWILIFIPNQFNGNLTVYGIWLIWHYERQNNSFHKSVSYGKNVSLNEKNRLIKQNRVVIYPQLGLVLLNGGNIIDLHYYLHYTYYYYLLTYIINHYFVFHLYCGCS